MGLMLGASAAQAFTVEVDGTGTNATAIRNLEYDGVFYDVVFLQDSADSIWGGAPFDFTTVPVAIAAANAASDALNTVPEVVTVGPDMSTTFHIPYDREGGFIVLTVYAEYNWDMSPDDWLWNYFYAWADSAPASYADFTVSEPPDPVPIGGTVSDLVGSGLVLQNNGSDDLPITDNGDFTFATELTPGSVYDVTVATQPTNPTQTCAVQNGSGPVPAKAVTDVAVTCLVLPPGNVSKVAAERETLPDGTKLFAIYEDGGVAINLFGEVAFFGSPGNIPFVYSQNGVVVHDDETLPDGTRVRSIFTTGGVAINLLGQVAFHGRGGNDSESALRTNVFTQAGQVAEQWVPLPDGTISAEINDYGGVAINLFGQVAFHSRIEVEGQTTWVPAVLTQDGLVVKEGDTLPDGTILNTISSEGGVAINDRGQVAFHGEVVDPDLGADTRAALFTQDGLVVKEGDILPDGTILGAIRKNAGVAINLFGQVAFQGRVFDPVFGIDTVAAVFTQDGLVVKEGDTLPDGTILEDLSETGGVAINDFGLVAFHGGIGSTKVVFTQNGLVAKEGDNLSDGTTTLEEISDTGGVSINFFGEVAFLGKINYLAVFVGEAPVAEGDEMYSE
jgi:hypothetical protein